MNRLVALMLGALVCSLGIVSDVHAASYTNTFDTPVLTGPTQAPGVWYPTNYAPAGFVSPTFFDGDNRLLHSISAADGANNRPTAFASSSFNEQGRQRDLDAGNTSISIDVFVPAGWQNSGRSMATLVGKGLDVGDSPAANALLEFTSDGNDPRFRGFNGIGWLDLDLPTGFFYDELYTLEMDLLPSGEFMYTVGDKSVTTNSLSGFNTVDFASVGLVGHNTVDGVSYDIYWDNIAAVPEPTSLALMGLGACMLLRRRRS